MYDALEIELREKGYKLTKDIIEVYDILFKDKEITQKKLAKFIYVLEGYNFNTKAIKNHIVTMLYRKKENNNKKESHNNKNRPVKTRMNKKYCRR